MESNEQFPALSYFAFPTGKRELRFGLFALLCGLALANFVCFAGFHLGYAVAQTLCILASTLYLWRCGRKPGFYSGMLLILSLVITAGFARSDDGFVKFVMVCFLFVSVNLGLGLQASQNRHSPAGFTSLADAPGVFFRLGFGKLSESLRGLGDAFRSSGTAGKKTGAVLVGLLLSVPLLVVVVFLLISADAAFAGLMGKLPAVDVPQIIITLLMGTGTACVLYTRGIALRYENPDPKLATARKGERKNVV